MSWLWTTRALSFDKDSPSFSATSRSFRVETAADPIFAMEKMASEGLDVIRA